MISCFWASSLTIFLSIMMLLTGTHAASDVVPGKHFDRVFIVVFENQDYKTAAKDKFMSSLADRYNGVTLTNYLATTHPSQPNYIAMISGSTDGTNEDDESNIKRKTIVDLLEKKDISWTTYQEDYPGHCNKETDIKNYARKHNPFMSFTNISGNKKRCAKIVNSKQLDKDIANNAVPQFAFYTPDLMNDAHDSSMSYASRWFKKFLQKRINNPAFSKNTMFVATFDEDDGGSDDNKVYTVLFGPDFHRSSSKRKDNKRYNHYSLLRTIEDNWDLGDLGQHDKKAVPIKL
ncbi:phosphoesterase family-domain-containing protein [Radiomyces spectabilis]|uniref:phosphoesterase family-domain-containing protein n=1 Tax=Radiomyces spectabilis TaxID=64574 RepID=UPI00221E470F|nr:phosphoesterase family-domain-containing protein [Radiomyces spectabilis]KAI8368249.1 phosphoesterase family-domain-containing protein [Radiomyces spectabilis]